MKIFDFKLTIKHRLNNDTNNLQVPFDVQTNSWKRLRIMRTVAIIGNRYFKLREN